MDEFFADMQVVFGSPDKKGEMKKIDFEKECADAAYLEEEERREYRDYISYVGNWSDAMR